MKRIDRILMNALDNSCRNEEFLKGKFVYEPKITLKRFYSYLIVIRTFCVTSRVNLYIFTDADVIPATEIQNAIHKARSITKKTGRYLLA